MARMNTVISLITVKNKTDTLHDVSAQDVSVPQSEFASAGLLGFKPSKKFIVWTADYKNERYLLHKSNKYTIYRCFPIGVYTEIYCERRAGNG